MSYSSSHKKKRLARSRLASKLGRIWRGGNRNSPLWSLAYNNNNMVRPGLSVQRLSIWQRFTDLIGDVWYSICRGFKPFTQRQGRKQLEQQVTAGVLRQVKHQEQVQLKIRDGRGEAARHSPQIR